MERYSNLYGTAGDGGEKGVYMWLGCSAGLPAFLTGVGAVNSKMTMDTVGGVLDVFPAMDGTVPGFQRSYDKHPDTDYPVAVCYAPMHLYKRPDMPKNMQPFSAVCVGGSENRSEYAAKRGLEIDMNDRGSGDKRIATYHQTYYIARDLMHTAVTQKVNGVDRSFNYLDQIFGTRLLGYLEVGDFKAGKENLDFDALPAKVTPRLARPDMATVFHAISTVFDDKSVVIRLEAGCNFNRRAWELLIPMYALMPPRLATEIGFATYLDPKRIRSKITETSIRVFVIPAEYELKDVEGSDILVLDLNDPKSLPAMPKDDLAKMLNRWNKMEWELRQPAMEKLFADTATNFNDKELFIQRSRDFFADPFFAWEKSDGDKGSITTLEGLKAKFDSMPLCAAVPWVKDRFVRKVPSLLKKGVTVKQLAAEALAVALYGQNETEKKQAQAMYRFAQELGGVEVIPCAKEAAKLASSIDGQKLLAQIAQTEAEMQRKQEEYQAEKTALIAAHAAAVAKLKAEQEAAIADLTTGHRTELAELERKHQTELTGLMDRHQTELTEMERKRQEELAKMEQQIQAIKEKAAEMIREARQRAEAAGNLAAETQQKLDEEQKGHAETKAALAEANERLERAKTAHLELKKKLEEALERLKPMDEAIAAAKQAEADARAAERAARQAEADAQKAKEKADKAIKDGNKRMIIGAAAGFLVAALIFGVILLVVSLVSGEPVETTDPAVIETTLATEPSEEPTEPTEEPTEAPTEPEPEVPDLSVWTDDVAARWLTEQVEGIGSFELLDPENLPEDLAAVDGYGAVALLRMAQSGEDSYAVLMQRLPGGVSDGTMQMDPDALADGGEEADATGEVTEPEETEAPTEETGAEPTEETEPGETTVELPVVEVEGARIVFVSEEFVLVVYGDDDTVAASLEVFRYLTAEPVQED